MALWKTFGKRAFYYLSNLLLVWISIFFFRTNSYYANFLRPEAQSAMLFLAMAFTIGSLVFYLLVPSRRLKEPKSATMLLAGFRLTRWLLQLICRKKGAASSRPRASISFQEKTAFLFLLVKFIFLPVMINGIIINLDFFALNFSAWGATGYMFSLEIFNNLISRAAISILFFIDTFVFSIGYLIEAGFLGNKVKSVEPTFFGWAVALICYPPANIIFFKVMPSNLLVGSPPNLESQVALFIINAVIFLLIFAYLWATLALGFKSSNLTNRGIVVRGPYAYVRHPAYVTKVLAWWLELALVLDFTAKPLISLFALTNLLVLSYIYHLRAYTEERHLIQDPDYVKYRKKVKHMYIPKFY